MFPCIPDDYRVIRLVNCVCHSDSVERSLVSERNFRVELLVSQEPVAKLHVQCIQVVVEPADCTWKGYKPKLWRILHTCIRIAPTRSDPSDPKSSTRPTISSVFLQIDITSYCSFTSRLGECATFSKILVHIAENLSIWYSTFRKPPLIFLDTCSCVIVAVSITVANIGTWNDVAEWIRWL